MKYSNQIKLFSDGQQFNQYQQREQPPRTSNNLTQKSTTTYGVGNPSPCLEHTHNDIAGLKWGPNSPPQIIRYSN